MTEADERVRPTLETDRLILRPFESADAREVQRLAGEKKIASTMLAIPHPYEDGIAEAWIATHQTAFENRSGMDWAITLRENGNLVGAVGLLAISHVHRHAEIGYWIGLPYWNRGYCTEAARPVLQYGFEVYALARIYSRHLSRNPASGRVMQKLGMTHEGRWRKHILKWDVLEDIEVYGILKEEWQSAAAKTRPAL